jgi:hypothetical protein
MPGFWTRPKKETQRTRSWGMHYLFFILVNVITSVIRETILTVIFCRQAGSIRSAGWNLTKKTDEEEKTQRFKVAEIITHPLFTSK